MRILGLDPGSLKTGFALVEKRGSKLKAIDSGQLVCARKAPLSDRLGFLATELALVVERLQPDAAALESTFQGHNPRSLIVLAQARGALLAVLSQSGVRVQEYSPAEVKVAVSGYGRADKEQVATMVRRILTLGTRQLSKDETDAFAIAICCAQMSRSEELAAKARGGRQ